MKSSCVSFGTGAPSWHALTYEIVPVHKWSFRSLAGSFTYPISALYSKNNARNITFVTQVTTMQARKKTNKMRQSSVDAALFTGWEFSLIYGFDLKSYILCNFSGQSNSLKKIAPWLRSGQAPADTESFDRERRDFGRETIILLTLRCKFSGFDRSYRVHIIFVTMLHPIFGRSGRLI